MDLDGGGELAKALVTSQSPINGQARQRAGVTDSRSRIPRILRRGVTKPYQRAGVTDVIFLLSS